MAIQGRARTNRRSMVKALQTTGANSLDRLLPILGDSSSGNKGRQQQGAEGQREFFKGRLVAGDCKNAFRPQPTPYGGDGIGEGHTLFPRSLYRLHPGAPPRQLAVQARHHTVQPKQVRRCPQFRLLLPAARTLQTEIRTHFLEGGFLIPATDLGFVHLLGAHRHRRRVKVLLPVGPGPVVDEDPAYRYQPLPRLIPPTSGADDRHRTRSRSAGFGPSWPRPAPASAPSHP